MNEARDLLKPDVIFFVSRVLFTTFADKESRERSTYTRNMASNEVFQTILGLNFPQQYKEMVSELERNFAAAKREASRTAEELIAKIRELERETLASLERTRGEKLQEINLAVGEAHTLVQQAIEIYEGWTRTQSSSSADFTRNEEILKQRIEELCVIPRHDTAFIKFTKAISANLKLGSIETSEKKSDAMQSGRDQTLQAGVETVLTLCPKTSDGQLSGQADVKDQVDILINGVMFSQKKMAIFS